MSFEWLFIGSFLEDKVSNINAIALRSKLSKHAFIYIIIRFSND